MRRIEEIPLITGQKDIQRAVGKALEQCRFEPPSIAVLEDKEAAVDYLNLELPELVFLHFREGDPTSFEFLDVVMRDPWLNHAGIVALCDDEDDADRLDELRDSNLVVVLQVGSLRRSLPRLLDVMHDNRRILFQRTIGAGLMPEIAGSFELANDHLEARCYTNLVCNFLFNANRIDRRAREALRLSIYEMLANAIEHGNCEITYEEKNGWLERNGPIAELIEQRCRDSRIADRRVTFEYTITSERSRFTIADEGRGFDWRKLEDATEPENLLRAHGRGILMTRAVTQNLHYNASGNEVSFEVAHQPDQASMTPALLRGLATRDFADGQTVFAAGDPGSCLFYIVKGRYDVIANGHTIATLTPEDIFVGEMSFLLNDRRSATVRASGEGKLIEIARKDFVEGIKRYPHYPLLLARLLAQRIDRVNRLQHQT